MQCSGFAVFNGLGSGDSDGTLGHRARISYRSRTVPKLLAWTAAMPSQAFARVLEVSLPSAAPCPDWRQSKDHPSLFLSLNLFVVLSDQSITRDREKSGAVAGDKKPDGAGARAALDRITAVLGVGSRL